MKINICRPFSYAMNFYLLEEVTGLLELAETLCRIYKDRDYTLVEVESSKRHL